MKPQTYPTSPNHKISQQKPSSAETAVVIAVAWSAPLFLVEVPFVPLADRLAELDGIGQAIDTPPLKASHVLEENVSILAATGSVQAAARCNPRSKLL